jgi:uncharacterized membrane protein
VYTALLFLHFVGLALGIGTGFASLTLGRAARDLEPPERGRFMMRASAISKNGSVGLALLLLTGVAMMLLRGVSETFAWGGGAFHAKLTLVAVFIGIFGYMQTLARRARREGGGAAMARLPIVGRIGLATGLAIVATAVLAFH